MHKRPFHLHICCVIVEFTVYPCPVVPYGPFKPRETSSRHVCSLHSCVLEAVKSVFWHIKTTLGDEDIWSTFFYISSPLLYTGIMALRARIDYIKPETKSWTQCKERVSGLYCLANDIADAKKKRTILLILILAETYSLSLSIVAPKSHRSIRTKRLCPYLPSTITRNRLRSSCKVVSFTLVKEREANQ